MTSSLIYFFVKVFISAILIVLIGEIAKRSTLFGSILASLPLTSLLAFIWFYVETKDTHRIAILSYDIFWLVLPSMICFLTLPLLLKKGVGFYMSLGVSCFLTACGYGIMLLILQHIRSYN